VSRVEFPWEVIVERTRSALNLNLQALTHRRDAERRADGELLLEAQSRLERYVRLAKAWKALAKERRRNPVADLYLASQLPVSAMALGAEKERARIVAWLRAMADKAADPKGHFGEALIEVAVTGIARGVQQGVAQAIERGEHLRGESEGG
jgi:hypothetical protein